jgi:hypothetical protein
MAPGAAIDASTVKMFAISAQMTEAKNLDAVTKSELRKLASRIGVLLAKSAPAATEEDEETKGKKPKKPAAADETADTPATMAQNDDPDAPTPGIPEDDDELALDIMSSNIDEDDDAPDDPDQGDDLDDDAESEKPAKKKGAKKDDTETEAERAAKPYTYQEALAQRLQKTILKHRVSNLGVIK